MIDEFMKLSVSDRKKVLGFYDWFTFRVLEQNPHIPMPFSYHPMEEWEKRFSEKGFFAVHKGRRLPAWKVTEARGLPLDKTAVESFRGKWLLVEFWGFW